MTTIRVLAAALLAIAVLALGLPGVLPLAALVALLAVGELWLRALRLDLEPATGRIGLGVVCGLVSLPLIALVLHVIGVLIRARSLAGGLFLLALVLGGAVLRRERSGRQLRKERSELRYERSGQAEAEAEAADEVDRELRWERVGPAEADRRVLRTVAAIVVPATVALVVGGTAVLAYVRLPHPPQQGYTSVALGGWAAGINGPVAVPADGLNVPIRVSSSGTSAAVATLSVIVDSFRAAPPLPVSIAADSTSSVYVHVPALPNGCLHRIEISLGTKSTVFYGRGPARC
ncbi:hypothetical protein ODJ79_32955 [Actinoplanes sp. KI2]|uniref:hypothetical protein n=1 Tax=Actinoplanes sp. KI2 TaxID=2983315 RepID=UPI0021D5A304|nr:hypothetical protein [Actinoplanes sp. KI2]MCU7728547.1 hypothetical protein [Actinoplanes sp. KI2]